MISSSAQLLSPNIAYTPITLIYMYADQDLRSRLAWIGIDCLNVELSRAEVFCTTLDLAPTSQQ